MMIRLRGLLALLGLAGILIGLPVVLIAVHNLGMPRFGWSWQGLLQALSSPDDGTLALAALKLAGWASWAILTLAIGVELIARLRHLPVPRLRGLKVPQSVARTLVTTSAALFVAVGTTTAAAPSLASPQPAHVTAPAEVNTTHTPSLTGGGGTHHVTKHRDAKDRNWTVQRGDTLSEIALTTTGKAANYPKLFRASRSTSQPGGRHLTDPDLILPGWKITIPATHVDKPSRTTKPKETTTTQASPTPSTPANASPAATVTPTTTTQAHPTIAAQQTETATGESAPAGWLLGGLAGAGALLAGGLWVTLRRRREAQFRSRRPGRTINVPDATLAPVEKTLQHQGAPTGELVMAIDELLRRLVATFTTSGTVLPTLVGLDANQHAFTLRFGQSITLATPWECMDDDAQIWRVARAIDLDLIGPLEQDSPPPWPQLVCLGVDAQGWRLINLEPFGIISLTGDPLYAADLARYIGTELAVAPWARDVEIDCLDICPELASLDPARVRYHHDPADVLAARVAAAITIAERLDQHESNLEQARVTFTGDELWDSHILIGRPIDCDDLDVLAELITQTRPGRTATAVLLVDDAAGHGGITMQLTNTGRLKVPQLDLDLVVNGLTQDEARGCAALLAAGNTLDDQPMPVDDNDAAAAWVSLADVAGSIRDELTLPRGTDDADAASVLPEPDTTYLSETANTESDLDSLAPLIPAQVRARVEAVDPALDNDLDQWWAESCDRPRIQVLGPVKVRVGPGGDPARVASRTAFYSELVTFLWNKPHGATSGEVAEAFGLTEARVRRDMTIVRAWLGADPSTGQPYLPDAMKAPLAAQRGVGLYDIPGAICDADLFRRLRLRGESRGPEGIQDLRHALRLVNGAPFDAMRAKGGVWLTETRVDQHLLCAIIDVAHVVSTIALASGDNHQAMAAAQLASLTAPYETTPRLDLAAALQREGHQDAATTVARDALRWRDIGGDPPADLTLRTEQIVRTHQWLNQPADKAS